MPTELRRITPDEVRAAYARTGLQPMRDTFLEPSDSAPGLMAACALGALDYEVRDDPDERPNTDQVVRRLGLDPWYAVGFAAGFDGGIRETDASEPYRLGYEDGAAAARAVFRDEED